MRGNGSCSIPGFSAKAEIVGLATHQLKASAIPVSAGAPANTGAAGASHRVACFAGEPAPTGTPSAERMRHTCKCGRARKHRRSRCQPPRRLLACPLPQGPHQPKECAITVGAGLPANTGVAGASHRVVCFAGMPAPTGPPPAERMRDTCGSGRAREHRRSRCHPPRRLLRGHARSHRGLTSRRNVLYLWERVYPRTPAQPVPATASPASRACPLPQETPSTEGMRCTCRSGLVSRWAAKQPQNPVPQ